MKKIDSFNENIEHHNNKQLICNECDGCLAHTGEQKACYPPIDIYKCGDCGKIVHLKQKWDILNSDNGNHKETK